MDKSNKIQELVRADEVANFLKISKLGLFGKIVSNGVLKVSKLEDLNRAYVERANLEARPFIRSMFDYLNIEYQIFEKDLLRIPKDGAFITVSNHPLGGIDGMILLQLLLEKRSDFKVMGNFLLERVKPLQPHLVTVNPFEDHKKIRSSISGLRMALQHLKEGKPLGMFPAGEVSTKQRDGIISDRPWTKEAIQFIKKANVPILPVYFHAKNSPQFYKIAAMNSMMRTAMLPYEMTTQHSREIVVRIGKKINVDTFLDYAETDKLADYLKSKTYLLCKGIKTEPVEQETIVKESISVPVEKALLQKEVDECHKKGKLLFEFKDFQVFIAKKEDIPNFINEIGRQREIAFREVGEGTNRSLDLDKFDDYYQHLFIYDSTQQNLVGAYRIGLGRDIYEKYGINGFYLSELFHFEDNVHYLLKNGVELGRAFVCKEYQAKPMSLFILWKGILMTLLKENYKYAIGGVSISNNYSSFSKSVMVDFLQSNYFDTEIAKFVKAKKEFKVTLSATDKELVTKDAQNDLKKLDHLIDEIEPQFGMKVPILLKKYIKQNVKLIGFNVDPDFSDALDGLMYVDIEQIPTRTLQSAIEEYQKSLEKRS